MLSYLRASDYFTAPSSYKRHGAWIGGNFDHSVAVTEQQQMAEAMAQNSNIAFVQKADTIAAKMGI